MRRSGPGGTYSQHEEAFWSQLRVSGLPLPVRQFPFAKSIGRKFAADFAWPCERLVVEINGGIWRRGRHNTGVGYENDLERNSLAGAMGWKVMGFSPRHVKSGWALEMTAVALGLREMDRSLANARRYR